MSCWGFTSSQKNFSSGAGEFQRLFNPSEKTFHEVSRGFKAFHGVLGGLVGF